MNDDGVKSASKATGGARAKLRAHFILNVGTVQEWQVLREVAGGITEWARRVRELRQMEGMNIQTDKDNSNLKPGQYLLADLTIGKTSNSVISKETRAYVLDRDGFTCQMCGVLAGENHPADLGRKARMHIGHIIDASHGGTSEPSNLRALCSVCNEGAQNITLPRPKVIQLLTQIRRAPTTEQLEVLEWLVKKFPAQAAKIVGKI